MAFEDNSLGSFDASIGSTSPIADTNGGVDTTGASSLVPLAQQATAQQSSGSLLGSLNSFIGAITPIAQTVLQATMAKPAAAAPVGDGTKTATPVSGIPSGSRTTGAVAMPSTIGGIPTTTILIGGMVLLGGLFLLKMNAARAR